jgi:hypothetical protein
MKRLLVCLSLLAVATVLSAQQHTPANPPASPAATASATIGGKAISIAYNSPRVKGRAGHLFAKDGLIGHDPQYPIWRAGANAATALHTEADLEIGGLKVPKGDYTLFVDLTDPANWVLVVSKQTGEWGLSFDKAQELGRVKMTMAANPALLENLTYTLSDQGKGKGKLTLAWENLSASVPLAAK